ncbi:MAG: oligosaccharide flippase family protein, partial [Candidatus Cloacimonetes bacterium]|nr:oligosaccharide flippase family protein [Candidatus Cloacimonadota bacterium]
MSSSIKKQATYLFVGRILAFVFQILIPIIFVRLLPLETYGAYQKIILICLFFAPLLQFGMSNSLLYFYPIVSGRQKQLLTNTFYFLLTIGILFSVLLVFFKNEVASLFNTLEFVDLIYPSALFILFYLVSEIIEKIFIVEQKNEMLAIYHLLNQSFRVIFLLVAIIIFRSLSALIWALVFFVLIKVIFLFLYLTINYGMKFSLISIKDLKEQFKYALPMGMGKIIGTIGKKIDKFILASLLISSDYAIYSVANFKLPFVQLIYTSIGSVALPKLSKIRDNGIEEIRQIWHKMIVTYTLITIPFLIYFELVAKEFILFLYTEKYIESITPFRFFLLIMLFQMLSYGTILKAYAKTRFIFKSNLIVMVIGFPISLSLIKMMGTVGGAISALIIFGLNAIIQVYKTKQILKLKLSDLLPWE